MKSDGNSGCGEREELVWKEPGFGIHQKYTICMNEILNKMVSFHILELYT